MTPLLLCAIASMALAQEADLPVNVEDSANWSTPGRGVAPEQLSVRVSESVAPWTQGTAYSFTTLTADLPWFRKHIRDGVVVATRVRMSGVAQVTATEDRTHLAPGNLQVEQWVSFEHDASVRWTHGFFLGAWVPIAGDYTTTSLFVHGAETAQSAGVYTGYQGYLDTDRFDLAIEVSAGLGTGPVSMLQLGETHASIHGFYEVLDGLPLMAGLVVTDWLGHVQVGTRWRPNERFDLGVGVNIPVVGLLGPTPDPDAMVLIQPMGDLRVAF